MKELIKSRFLWSSIFSNGLISSPETPFLEPKESWKGENLMEYPEGK
jgi:hypothetical protein